MAIAASLAGLQSSISQCDQLIANAHVAHSASPSALTPRDVEQITEAAFLNLFIAWEEFVEAAIADFMTGCVTLNGSSPVRYVAPPSREHASKMVVHANQYFDYANHDRVKTIAGLFFDGGYPFASIISSISQELGDLKTIRNACAHMSSSTRNKLENLAVRIFGNPHPGINVYTLLISTDPRTNPRVTVYAAYRDKLVLAANLIATG